MRPGLAVRINRRLQSDTQWWVRLNTPHTQKFGHFPINLGEKHAEECNLPSRRHPDPPRLSRCSHTLSLRGLFPDAASHGETTEDGSPYTVITLPSRRAMSAGEHITVEPMDAGGSRCLSHRPGSPMRDHAPSPCFGGLLPDAVEAAKVPARRCLIPPTLRPIALIALTLAAPLALAGCATNGELGFAGHPLDCAIGVAHSDCAPGTPGANRYEAGPSPVVYYGGPSSGDRMMNVGAAMMGGGTFGEAMSRASAVMNGTPMRMPIRCETYGPTTTCY